ncbi:MAG TPA: hypothetical protein PLF40_10040 [Kofleriaceae bacterium]|nr:hypothetical protein [Kofleriaceae bacterium]
MTRRTLIAGTIIAIAVAVTVWWQRSHRPNSTAAAPAAAPVNPRAGDSPLHGDRSGKLPVLPKAVQPDAAPAPAGSKAIPIQEVDIAADKKMRAEHELTYRIARLRFLLAEAAAPCYQGGPSDEKINVGYTIVVHNDELHIENLRVHESSIRDSNVQNCLIAAVRDLRTLAPNIGELRQENDSWIALADLADNNRRYERSNAP